MLKSNIYDVLRYCIYFFMTLTKTYLDKNKTNTGALR